MFCVRADAENKTEGLSESQSCQAIGWSEPSASSRRALEVSKSAGDPHPGEIWENLQLRCRPPLFDGFSVDVEVPAAVQAWRR